MICTKIHEEGVVAAPKRDGKVQSNGECSFLAEQPHQTQNSKFGSLLWNKNGITRVYIWYVIRILLGN